MTDEIAIRVNEVSKDFVLPHEKVTSLKSLFTGNAKRGKRKEMQHALKGITFDIKKGEFFGIVGRNGSGKSTLLKILAGIYQPTSGGVETRGKVVPFIELGVGFNPELTGRENVNMNGAMLGFSRKEVGAMYNDIVSFAELERFMDQKLKNYSSGMQVRLAFSMAVRAEADILLIDEVLAVGDADFQRKCYEYFKSLKKEKITVVFVSHDMNAVTQYCDRAALIDENEVKEIGRASEVSEEYLKLFSNTPAQALPQKKGERWGDGRAKVKKLRAQLTDDMLSISYEIQAYDDLEEIVAGFRIRSSDGENVTGTNTVKEKQRIQTIKKDDRIQVRWEIPNIFSDGKYYIDPALVYADEITVYDWWNEAETFSVDKNRKLPFVVDPGFRLTVGKN